MFKKNSKVFLIISLMLLSIIILSGCSQEKQEQSAGSGQTIRMATTIDFYEREDGLPGLEEAYGFEFDNDALNTMQVGLSYEALDSDKVDAAVGFATDGRIAAMDLAILKDDKGFFPVYNPAPLVRKEILEEYPDLKSLINKLPPLLDQETQIELNKRADVDGEEPDKIAEEFLEEHDLLIENAEEKDGPAVAVASKPWTEQLILGNMTVKLLENHGYPVEDRTSLGETSVLRPAIESGEIDIYWEYTGTTLMTTMGHEEEIIESEEAYNTVKKWDENNNNIIWLDYADANNTFCIMMTEEKSEKLGITTISELAEYINNNK
ncbi:MAG: glycine betaine ABC transporter substrate-binding protein [Bacillota bacterium]